MESRVYLDGKLVDASVISPEKHKFIGMFRPIEYDCLCPVCGVLNPNLDVSIIKQHWTDGHFDVPQYQTIVPKSISELLTDYGVFQYCKFHPSGGIEATFIENMVNEFLNPKP